MTDPQGAFQREVETRSSSGVTIARTLEDSEGRYVRLQVTDTHEIWVERDRAWSGFHEAPPGRYLWEGGVPDPKSPKAPHDGLIPRAKVLLRDPVGAVMTATRKSKKLSREDRKTADTVWLGMWEELLPHLDQRAATLAARYGYPAPLYTTLASRPDLADHLEICPALGPFLRPELASEVPEKGWSLKEIAEFLLDLEALEVEASPGFLVWAKSLEWGTDRLPIFPRGLEEGQKAMQSFVLAGARLGESLDPNGIQKLETDDEWLLVNQALASDHTAHLVPAILQNPKVALKRLGELFPPDTRMLVTPDGEDVLLDRRGRIVRGLEIVREWELENREEAERVDSFSGLAKRARKWDQSARSIEQVDQERQMTVGRVREERLALARERYEEERRALGMGRRGAGLSRERLETPFPGLPPEEDCAIDDGQFRMRILRTPADLLLEGSLAGHCVGGYGHIQGCQKGEYLFLTVIDTRAEERAVRSGTTPPVPLATYHVNARTFGIREARGARNRAVPGPVKKWVESRLQTMRARVETSRAEWKRKLKEEKQGPELGL